MTPAGLLAVCLCAPTVGAPPAESPSRYNRVGYPAGPVDVPGRATLAEAADVSGRASLNEPVDARPAVVPPPTVGRVFEPAYAIDRNLCEPTVGYVPQAGDIVLVVSDHFVWQLLFAIALSCEPYHVGIVVRMPDGSYGMLEAGPPDQTAHVRICPLAERLAADAGRVFIRRRCVPLTAEQSGALTGFALRQDGKPYAYLRFLAQGTPVRSRGPIRTEFMGKSRGEPWSYFCSELVVEAVVSAGLIDAETARPRATTPADIFYDQSTNPWIDKYLKLAPCWCPPQRWVAAECGR
jgi:hypothetical protein